MKEAPLLTAVDVDHSSLPVLHLMLGVVNKVEESLMTEIQAGCEAYTPQYVNLECNLEKLKEWHAQFSTQKTELESQLCKTRARAEPTCKTPGQRTNNNQ